MTLLLIVVGIAVIVACSAEPEVVEVTRVVTETQTEIVTEQVEVTRVVDGETITEFVEVEVTAVPEPAMMYPGVTIEGLMRNSFIPEMNQVQLSQAGAFEAMTDAVVDLTFSTEWREQVAAAIESGAGGDISELFANQAFIYGDQLLDVSDIAEELDANYGGWYELGREASVVDGVWRAIPRAYTAQAINYREDIFAAAGVETIPTTYAELLEAARKIYEAGLPPMGFTMNQAGPNDSANFAYSLLWSMGGKEVEEDGCTVAINSPETRVALEYMIELGKYMAPDVTAYDEGGNNRAFLGGEISATQNATSIYWTALRQGTTTADGVNIAQNMNHFPYPAGPAGRQEFVQMNLLSIPAHTENPEAAKAWLRWMMQPPQLGPLSAVGITFYTPLLHYYDDDPSMPWNTDPKLAALKGSADGGHLAGWPGPASRQSAEAYENQTIVNMFASVLTGTDVESAVTRAEEELSTVYSCDG
jgi:multiple sugar transport system substrate-binding protein